MSSRVVDTFLKRCECHDCTQTRARQPMFYDPAVVNGADLPCDAIPAKTQGCVPIMRISDGTDVYLGSSAGGGHPDGEWSHLTLEFHKDGKVWLKHFSADDLGATPPPNGDPTDLVMQGLARVINDERERCAKIADEYANDPHGSNPSCATGEAIAARIRSVE